MHRFFQLPGLALRRAAQLPLSINRIISVLHAMGYDCEVDGSGELIRGRWDGVIFHIQMQHGNRWLAMTASHEVIPEQLGKLELQVAANDWNRERLVPTMYLSERGSQRIYCADYLVDCGAGVSDAQLASYLDVGLANGILAISMVASALSDVPNPEGSDDD